jgi:hypothetical protein
VRKDGLVGPLAWLDESLAGPLLGFAARQLGGPLRFTAPGSNHRAIRFAFQHGLRLAGHSHLLMTEPVGRMDCYVPSGTELF